MIKTVRFTTRIKKALCRKCMVEVQRFAIENQVTMNLSNREKAIEEINEKLTEKLCKNCKDKVIKIMGEYVDENKK